MSGESLQRETRDGVTLLRLNRPHVLNALDPSLLSSLLGAVEEARRDPAVRCLVLTGAGRAFCAGADLKAMLAMSREAFAEFIAQLQQLSAEMRRLAKPSIAAVNGYALAGGFELAVICDIRVAAENASFGLPDASIGLSPTSGLTYLLPRIVGLGWAKHLTFTGETIDARQAERIGLVTRVTPAGEVETAALAMAGALARCPSLGLRHVKLGFDTAADVNFAAALVYETEAEVACFDTEEVRANLRRFAERKKRKG